MSVICLDEAISENDAAGQVGWEFHSLDAQSALCLSQDGQFEDIEFRGQGVFVSSNGEGKIGVRAQVVAVNGGWEQSGDGGDEFSGSDNDRGTSINNTLEGGVAGFV